MAAPPCFSLPASSLVSVCFLFARRFFATGLDGGEQRPRITGERQLCRWAGKVSTKEDEPETRNSHPTAHRGLNEP